MAGGGGGWADLSPDLFSFIFSKLSLPQFLRSAAVCVSWSAAVRHLSTRSGCFKFGGQSPWLVLYDDPPGDPSAVTFFAFDERREYTIPVSDPPLTDRLFLGSAHGWIITIDVRLHVHLLNPITGTQIDLPRAALLSEDTDPIRDAAGRLIGFMMPKPVNEEHGEQHRLKAILSADPSLGDGYAVALIQHTPTRILFTRSGDEQWHDLRNPLSVENIVFHKGKLYMTTLSGMYVCDLKEVPRFRVIDRALHLDGRRYLLETPRGDLLSIRRERNENLTETISVKIYRVTDEEEPGERLEKTMELGGDRVVVEEVGGGQGDFIIFSGDGHSLCLSADDFPHLTPNSIYFMDPLLSAYLLSMFLEGNWFRKILNRPIMEIDDTFVRLYWHPPSSSIH